MLIDLLGIDQAEAESLLHQAEGSVKLAIVMYRLGCDRETAVAKLAAADGFVRRVLR